MDLKYTIPCSLLLVSCIRFYCEARTLVACPKRNMFIQIESNGNQKCMTCSPCPKGTQKKRCSLWHNSDCETCPVGYYNRKENSRCKQCTVCKPGERVMRKCSPTEDAICAHCPAGTYTRTINLQWCSTCTRCKPNEEVLYTCNSTHNYGCGSCTQEYFRESATGGCLPCSKCQGDLKVVPECYLKNEGYSDKNCMPSDRIWGIFHTTASSTSHTAIQESGDQFYGVLLPFLFIILFSSIVIVSVFICIHSSTTTQKCIRKTGDTGRNNIKKLPADEGDYGCRRKRNKLSEIIQSSWYLIKQYLSTDNGIVRLHANENSCCEDLIKGKKDQPDVIDFTETCIINQRAIPEKNGLKMLIKEKEETVRQSDFVSKPGVYLDDDSDTGVNVRMIENTTEEGEHQLCCIDRINIDSRCDNSDEQNKPDDKDNSNNRVLNLKSNEGHILKNLESTMDLSEFCSYTRCDTGSEKIVSETQFSPRQTRNRPKRNPMETIPSKLTNTTYLIYSTL